MAYNKTKNAEAAQKFLHQGKTAQAIAEYLTILKHEPKDQITLMTVGDLYVRQGETFQALEYFERLAQIFLADGFVTKAIAIYKKIAKLAPEENRPVERLAELYIQQGVLSEARPIYLQLAEMHQRAGRHPQAAALLRKLHEAEPENLRVLTQMAEMLHASNQKAEAAAAHRLAAEQLHRRGDHAEAIKHADRALEVSPTDESTIMLKALSLSASGQRTEAVELLKSQPQLDGGGKVSEQLLDLYLEAGERELACDLTEKLFANNPKHFAPAHRVATALLEAGEPDRALLLLDVIREAMTDAGEHEALSQSLVRAAERLPKRIEPREWLVELYGRTSDSFRMSDALADLGAVCEGAGRYDRARQVYEQLLDREPENESVRRKLESVKAHLGLAPGLGASPSSGSGSLENTGLSSEALSGTSSDGSGTRAQTGQPPNAALQMPASQLPGQHSGSRPSATTSSSSPTSSASRASGSKGSDNGASSASNNAEPLLDDETQQFVSQSLTDVDLFSSYGLTQKAIDLLEVVVQRAPRHTPSIERLLDLYLGAGDERRTAELASLLQKIYTQSGDPASADRFAELRRRYERAAGITSEQTSTTSQAAAPEFSVPLVEAEPLPDEETMPEVKALLDTENLADAGTVETTEDFAIIEPGVHEVDLSEEWAALAGILTDTPTSEEPAPQVAAAVVEAAPEAVKSEQQPDPQPVLDSILGSDEALIASAEAVNDEAIEISPATLENIPVLDSAEFALELEPYPETAETVPALDSNGFLSSLSAELDAMLPDLMGPQVPAGAVSSNSQSALTISAQAAQTDAAQISDEKSTELSGISGSTAPAPGVSDGASSGATTKSTTSVASRASAGPLGDVFDQFKADMGEVAAEDEDLETHYNLGIAYREMGLLEEAISEFQKVAKANQQGQPFRYSMQCCTLLGLAFMDKNQPGIAAMWYERALETPGLDQESILALRYDLGVAQELAGEKSAARKSFSQVYGMNIDYRDVAERLGALGKGS